MLQPCGELDVAREAVGTGIAHDLGRNHFDDNVARERRFGGHEHARHATTAKFALEVVAAREGRAQLYGHVWHTHGSRRRSSLAKPCTSLSFDDVLAPSPAPERLNIKKCMPSGETA